MTERVDEPHDVEPMEVPGPPPIATRQHLAGLEGPRGFACLCIILVHVAVHFAPGVLAVTRVDFFGQSLTFFFALSGFLLYMPYVQRLVDDRGMPKTSTYLRRRVLRVFPAYLVIFLITNFVLRAAYVENPFEAGWSNNQVGVGMTTDPVKLLAQLTLTQSLFPSTLQTGINPTWSLTTEWGFYLILPVIGGVLFSLRGRMRRPLHALTWPPLLLLVTGVATNTMVGMLQAKYYSHDILEGYWGPNWTAVLSRSFFSLADAFAFGMFAAVIYVALTKGAFKNVSTRRVQWIAVAVGAVGLGGSLALFVLSPRYMAAFFGLATAAFILLVVAPLARNEHSAVATVTDWRPIRYVGLISLSMYVWHYPVLLVVERLHLPLPDTPVGLLLSFLLVAALSIVVSSITYRWVELPAMKYRGRGS